MPLSYLGDVRNPAPRTRQDKGIDKEVELFYIPPESDIGYDIPTLMRRMAGLGLVRRLGARRPFKLHLSPPQPPSGRLRRPVWSRLHDR